MKIPEMGSCFGDRFVKTKRERGTREGASRESSRPLAKKQATVDDGGGSETSLGVSSSSSSDNSSGRDGTPVGILMAPGERAEDEDGETSVKCESHGLISVIGRRRSMEDAVAVAVDGEIEFYDFFAVYDGHGGAHAANMCRDRLHFIVAEEVHRRRFLGGGCEGRLEYWGKVMAASFAKMDGKVIGEAVKCVGSTAVVVMVGEEELVVANCGDSRAVLYRGGVALPLSRDHKPDRPDEKERVEAAGGRVLDWNGSRVLGVLATSRSIGDHYLKPYVISEPEVMVSQRMESDEFIVMASDGLWDVVSNEYACEVVRRFLLNMRFTEEVSGGCAAEAAAVLAELAMARGSNDNISVLVIVLRKYSSGSTSNRS